MLRHSFENAQRRERMGCYVLGFQEINQTQVPVVGGKGAHLGELSRIKGLRVPAAFCVTTDAFQRIMAEAPSIDYRLDRLSRLKPDERETIRALSLGVRRTLEAIAIPDDLAAAITRSLARLGEQAAYAVRSSATAEDLPTASFAGQQDTYLNVVGPAAILQHVSRCWASLFTERAVTYRRRDAATGDRAGAPGPAGAAGCAGRAARAAGPADRSAFRPPPGHRMVPGRRWLRDRPEPADHHTVPHPRGRRPREPRLRLPQSSADDDRRHE